MAFTFTLVSINQMAGVGSPAIYTATTDTSSAAGTINCGFVPRVVEVRDQTNANLYTWNAGMPAASVNKTVTAGTYTYAAANGITKVDPSTGATAGVTLGTALHTNSSSYVILLWP